MKIEEEFMPEFDAGIESMDQDSKDAVDKSVRIAQLIHELKNTTMKTMKLSDYIAEIEREAMDEAVGMSVKVSNLSEVDRDAAIRLMDSIIEYLIEKKDSL